MVRPLLFEVELRAARPVTTFDSDDPFFDLDTLGARFGRDVVRALVRDHAASIRQTGSYQELSDTTGMDLGEMVEAWPDRIPTLPPVLAYLALETPDLVAALKAAGHDVVVVGGCGENALETEWHALDPACVRVIRIHDLAPDVAPERELEDLLFP